METPVTGSRPVQVIELKVQELTRAAWAPYGQVIRPATHGGHFGGEDAQLILDRGVPRYYIMTLPAKKLEFNLLTRHLKVTQCLSSVGGKDWLIAVAPPNDPDDPLAAPDPQALAAFRVPGDVAIMLHRSTWHIGPYTTTSVSFFNLELADTNQADHYPVRLDESFGFSCRFSGALAEGV